MLLFTLLNCGKLTVPKAVTLTAPYANCREEHVTVFAETDNPPTEVKLGSIKSPGAGGGPVLKLYPTIVEADPERNVNTPPTETRLERLQVREQADRS